MNLPGHVNTRSARATFSKCQSLFLSATVGPDLMEATSILLGKFPSMRKLMPFFRIAMDDHLISASVSSISFSCASFSRSPSSSYLAVMLVMTDLHIERSTPSRLAISRPSRTACATAINWGIVKARVAAVETSPTTSHCFHKFRLSFLCDFFFTLISLFLSLYLLLFFTDTHLGLMY